MEDVNVTQQPSLAKKVITYFGYILIALAVVGTIAHFVWKSSGSGEWVFLHEIDGIKVFTLKEPGQVLEKYKVIGRFQAKLGPIMKVMRDPAACDEVGCYNSYIIKTEEYPRLVYYTFTYPLPEPFLPREYVVLSEYHQDPETKNIYVDFKTVDNVLPESDCCVRVKHMHNKWEFFPKEDGIVEVQFTMNHDPAGNLPYFMVNADMRDMIHTNIPDLQAVLDLPNYKDAVVDYVLEVGDDPSKLEAFKSQLSEITSEKTSS